MCPTDENAEFRGELPAHADCKAGVEPSSRISAGRDDFERLLLQIGRDCASRLKEPYRSIEHGELLYDERGLPK